MREPRPGDLLDDRLLLLERIARGATAEIWKVRETGSQRILAAKIPLEEDRERALALLKREHAVTHRIDHPAVLAPVGLVEAGPHPALLLPWMEGGDLRRLLGEDPPRLARLLAPVAEALARAHDLGVVHGDPKPSNVLLGPKGEAHLADWGSARAEDLPGPRSGGSPHGLAPDRSPEEAPTPADDVHAFGVLLHEALTGLPPSPGGAPLPETAAARIPPAFGRLLEELLAPRGADRPPMDEVAVRLRRLAEELPPAPERHTAAPSLEPPPRPEPIAPRGPASAGPGEARPRRRSLSRPVLIVAGLALTAASLVAIHHLAPEPGPLPAGPAPGAPAEKATATPSGPAETPKAEVAPQAASSRREAEEALSRARRLLARLEEGAAAWAGPGWSRARARLDEAADAFFAEDWAGTVRNAREAARLLESEERRFEELLAAALQEGDRALEAGDAPSAAAAFEHALELSPSSEQARRGRERALVLDRLLARMEEGARLEKAGSLEAARERYAAAAELDPASIRPPKALRRIEEKLAERAFARLLARTVTAYEAGELEAAQEALEGAAKIAPGRDEIALWRERIGEARRARALAELREEARRLERAEMWREAMARYEKALEIDPGVGFARQGLEHARRRAALADRIQAVVESPERLQSEEVLEEARALLEEAREVDPRGPRHERALGQLAAAVESATRLVPVTLLSDDQTRVVVYRVGRLGTFDRRVLELRPGRYTVVGSRPGYRDVRREILVEPGSAPEPTMVSCQERI